MKLKQRLTELWLRCRAKSRWHGLKEKLAGPFARAVAAIVGWRKRGQKTLSDNEIHTFQAREYPGSRTRHYRLHVPGGEAISRSRPLVIVLHGCQQTQDDIEQITGFNQLADQNDFIVAYPFVTSYRGLRSKNCWGWWFDREIHAGAGEVEDLWQIVEEIKLRYAVNEKRIHVTGLSSGGGMAVAMMVAHADQVASGAAVAGVPYSEGAASVRHALNRTPRSRPLYEIVSAMQEEIGEAGRAVPIKIVHSKDDDKVDIQSAENLRDSWGHCFGIDTRHPYAIDNGRVGDTVWEHCRYREGSGKSVIETLFLEGPGHGWYGGNPGNFSFLEAPDIKHSIWDFFVEHPLEN